LAKSSIRVLVVDDFQPFRRVVASIFHQQPELQIISEVSDGLEAVQKAEELRPDLILLDIGLPKLNGIQAARRMRKVSPLSRILFVSQASSADVVQEALSLGARGYIVKSDAGSELLTAVNAVLRGETFVSSRLASHDFTGAPDAQTSQSVHRDRVSAPASSRSTEIAHHHEVGFYSTDRCLLDDLTQFIGAALKAGNAAIVVATGSHRDSLLPRLHSYGLDMGAAIEQGRYIALDAADTLSTFMVNGMPDPARFAEGFGNLILTAARATMGSPHVAIFGECVHLLWAQGSVEAAIQLEKLGNQLARTYNVHILCGYSLGNVQDGMDGHCFQRICAEHSAVYSR
jgi:DNA-binding NarL/FixJ family response regulator